MVVVGVPTVVRGMVVAMVSIRRGCHVVLLLWRTPLPVWEWGLR